MSVAEIQKFMTDHKMGPKVIAKEDVKEMVKLVNMSMSDTGDLKSLTYDGFIQYIIQIANFMYTQPPTDMSHLPPIEHVKELLK